MLLNLHGHLGQKEKERHGIKGKDMSRMGGISVERMCVMVEKAGWR